LGEVEGGSGIGLSELDDLGVVVLRTFNGRRIAVLDQTSGFGRGGARRRSRCCPAYIRLARAAKVAVVIIK
jgi:hypothetical protein